MNKTKKSVAALAVLSAAIIGGSFSSPQPAEAGTTPSFSCGVTGDGASHFVTLLSLYPNPCFIVQVRMFRYEGTTINTYLGSQGQASGNYGAVSLLEYYNGTNAGNSGRVREYSPSLMSGWFGLPPGPAGWLKTSAPSNTTPMVEDALPPSAEDFAIARESATSALERAALSDGSVSEIEYQSAYEEYAACVTDNGWTASTYTMPTVGAIGLKVEGRAEGSEFDAALDKCRIGTVGIIESLYLQSNVFTRLTEIMQNLSSKEL